VFCRVPYEVLPDEDRVWAESALGVEARAQVLPARAGRPQVSAEVPAHSLAPAQPVAPAEPEPEEGSLAAREGAVKEPAGFEKVGLRPQEAQ
jgi:hypothetical protein